MSSADTMGADARYCRLTSASRCRFSTLVIDIVRCRARKSLKFFKFVMQMLGKGSVLHGGTVADVGHLYAFGNTEERYRIKILGCKGKGVLGVDRPFDHTTKVGSVKERAGDYDDALFATRRPS